MPEIPSGPADYLPEGESDPDPTAGIESTDFSDVEVEADMLSDEHGGDISDPEQPHLETANEKIERLGLPSKALDKAVRPEARSWVRTLARNLDTETIQAADEYMRAQVCEEERSQFPDGLPMSPERRQLVSDLGQAAVFYIADTLGLDVGDRQIAASNSDIRFFSDADRVAIEESGGGYFGESKGFNTPMSGFIGVHEDTDPAVTAETAQHEILHHLGARQHALVRAGGVYDVVIERNGLVMHDNFTSLDEAVVIDMTDRVQQEMWDRYTTTRPFADATPLDIRMTRQKPEGSFEASVVWRTFLDVVCERASDSTGEDVRMQLQTDHFTGGVSSLRALHRAFGSVGVANLAHLGKASNGIASSGEILSVVDNLGAKKDFLKRLYSYKK